VLVMIDGEGPERAHPTYQALFGLVGEGGVGR
jgi:hypothetical protein